MSNKVTDSLFSQLYSSFSSMVERFVHTSSPMSITLLDPNRWENALIIFDVSEAEAHNLEAVNKKYHSMIQLLEERKAKASKSIAISFEELIQNIHLAYQTLIKGKPL